MTRPHHARPPRARSFAAAPDDHGDALADVEMARADVEAVRRLAAVRKAGASDVSAAEYKLHAALRRLDRDGWTPPSEPAAAEPENAA